MDLKFWLLGLGLFGAVLKAVADYRKDLKSKERDRVGSSATLVGLVLAVVGLPWGIYEEIKDRADQSKRQQRVLTRILLGQKLSTKQLVLDLDYSVFLTANQFRDLVKALRGDGRRNSRLVLAKEMRDQVERLPFSLIVNPSIFIDVKTGPRYDSALSVASRDFTPLRQLDLKGELAFTVVELDGRDVLEVSAHGIVVPVERGDRLPHLLALEGQHLGLVFPNEFHSANQSQFVDYHVSSVLIGNGDISLPAITAFSPSIEKGETTFNAVLAADLADSILID